MGKPVESNSLKTCCVPQCKSRQTSDISLFSFPKDEALKKRWTDAMKTDKRITPQMQICSRHFTKNDYVISGTTKKLKKAAVPTQNLPWQFPNKRVSPTLAKARMERLKNRTQQKTPDAKRGANKKTPENTESSSDDEKSDDTSVPSEEDPFDKLLAKDDDSTGKNIETPKTKEKSTPKIDKSSESEEKDAAIPDRAPTRLTQREGVLKCELCGRKCLTPQALRTHQQIAHKNKNSLSDSEKDPLAMIKVKESPKSTPTTYIAVKQRETLMELKSLKKVTIAESASKIGSLVEQVLQNDDTTETESDDSRVENGNSKQFKPQKKDKRKTEFECPKCKKRFAVLFSARKHIEKHHMGAEQQSIGPSSKRVHRSLCEERPQLAVKSSVAASYSTNRPASSRTLPPELRPVRIEVCSICNATLTGNIHLCAGPLKLALGFVCTACNQEFKTLSLFDLHKSGMHSDGVESMFFPTLDEFNNWKDTMESQTRVSYSVLDQNDTKKTHRCTHVVHTGTGSNTRSRMCPSSVIVQEFTKGFQVHYYPTHYGHASTPYNLSKAYSKYSIASLMNITASKLPDDSEPDDDDSKETDLYVQFRKLTEYLVTDAARINVRGLKLLMRKALDMIGIINNYNEDEDCLTLSDADDDLKDQVKAALKRYKGPEVKKRPSSTVIETPVKRSKPVFQSTENTLKEKPKAVRSSPVVVKMKVGNENVNEQKNISEPKNQSSTFIDSFQEFVGKGRLPITRKRKNNTQQQNEKKEIVKTKMGQFKPSPKKTSSPTDPLSPKRNSIINVKDVEYEVKEQENDCNILILKI